VLKRTLVAWSGGKDSALALAAARGDAAIDVVGLLTAVTPAFDRISIHGTRRSILRAQAERLGLPVFEATIQSGSDNAAYEAAWSAALARAREDVGVVDAIVYGDLFLTDVRAYRERQCEPLHVEPLFPLWGQPTAQLAERAVREGYVAYLTCVDTQQLDAAFAGRVFDAELLRDLPVTVDPCGERGEFHTVVVGAPSYRSAISVYRGERVLRDARFNYCDFEIASGLT
jgi:uncharacterized protein (TIGR00290 family)